MPTLLISNWKYFAAAIALLAAFMAGDHYRGLSDDRAASELVQAQQIANAKAQAELDAKAKAAEAALAAERIKSADLANQWEKERHAKAHTSCTLSLATRRLLQAASGE